MDRTGSDVPMYEWRANRNACARCIAKEGIHEGAVPERPHPRCECTIFYANQAAPSHRRCRLVHVDFVVVGMSAGGCDRWEVQVIMECASGKRHSGSARYNETRYGDNLGPCVENPKALHAAYRAAVDAACAHC